MNWWEGQINSGTLKRASSTKTTPVNIDRDNKTGRFNGSSNTSPEPYATSLEKCNCGAHGSANSPCKHMCRLAMELGLLDLPFDTDKRAVSLSKYQRGTGYAVSEMVERLEKTSLNAQMALRKYFRMKSCAYTAYAMPKRSMPFYEELAAVDLVEILEGDKCIMSQNVRPQCRLLNRYLMRKFDTIDETFEMSLPYDSPLGAEIHPVVDLETGATEYVLAFPNDEITDLLNKYDTNPLNPPKPVIQGEDGRWEIIE